MNLNIEEHERNTEQKIIKQMEQLKTELEPFEKVCENLKKKKKNKNFYK